MSIDNAKNNPDKPKDQGTSGAKDPGAPTHGDTNPPRPGEKDPDHRPPVGKPQGGGYDPMQKSPGANDPLLR